jgi:excisionase family DNA binding protein
MGEEILTARQVAERLALGVSRVYELARRGEIPHVRIGRVVRFRWSAVEAWFVASETGGGMRPDGNGRRLGASDMKWGSDAETSCPVAPLPRRNDAS